MNKKDKFRQASSFFLAAMLIVTNIYISIPVGATVYTEEAVSSNSVSSNHKNVDRLLTYHDEEDPVPVLSVEDEQLYAERGLFPAKYSSVDMGKTTTLKNQGSYGSCWAFATIGACESGLISQGYASENVDLSERHLAYYFYEKGKTGDALGGTYGDYNTALGSTASGAYDYKNRGGNALFSMWHLASWAGLADESAAPYENFGTPLPAGTTQNVYGTNTFHLQNAIVINKANTDAIKQTIMNYGSMATSYYSSYSTDYDQVMEGDYGCYYYNKSSGTNHAVQVVGWDDNFSKDNFAITPEGNGAWLIKNSWGDEDSYFAQDGYFWMSYYDASLASNFYAFACEKADNYDNIYQYDGASGATYYSVGSAANIFEAKANSVGEKIEAVGIGNYSNGTDYTLTVYTDLTDDRDPSSGTVALRQNGTLEYSGYHTIQLNTPITVDEGKKFSVVFDFATPTYLYADMTYSYEWISFQTEQAQHTTFYKSRVGLGGWEDLVTASKATFRIKAYTSNINTSESIRLESIKLDRDTMTMESGGTARLKVSYTPSNTTDDRTVVWTSSDSEVVSVDHTTGELTAKKAGTATVTAECGTKSASCVITVKEAKYSIQNVDSEAGTFEVRLTRLNELANLSEVKVAVWSAENGQDDLIWYTARSLGNGVYSLPVNIACHGAKPGSYCAHAYAFDKSGNAHFWGGGSCLMTKTEISATSIRAAVSSDEEKAEIVLSGVKGVSRLQVAVWSDVNGQDDLIWYNARNKGNGTWSLTVPIANHRYSSGSYSVHAYAGNVYTSLQFLKNTSFSISGPNAGSVSFQNVNADSGTFSVDIKGASAKAGIAAINVAVWSKADQSNIRWYPASRQSDGSYRINVNLANHGYEYGIYHAHAYVTDRNGCSVLTAGNVEMKQPKANLVAKGNATQTLYNITATGVGYPGGVTGARIAVWSNAGGQDDLIWYSATNLGNGKWSINVPIANHRSAGSYSAHMYIIDSRGSWHLCTATSFFVDTPDAGKVSIQNADNGAGVFTVKITGASSVAGIAEVNVAIWSKSDQSNIRWYPAARQGDGSYQVNVNLASHGYEYGVYHAHAYVKSGNGISLLTAGNVEMKQPTASLGARGNANQTVYSLTATDVGYPGGVKEAKIAVWSSVNGQDDLIWYNASNRGNGVWTIDVPIVNHRDRGSYIAHMYIVDSQGGWHFGAATIFRVNP